VPTVQGTVLIQVPILLNDSIEDRCRLIRYGTQVLAKSVTARAARVADRAGVAGVQVVVRDWGAALSCAVHLLLDTRQHPLQDWNRNPVASDNIQVNPGAGSTNKQKPSSWPGRHRVATAGRPPRDHALSAGYCMR
jgi:hypothetical protein